MALLEEKIAEIKDPELRRIIDEEVKALKKEKPFGLVFERHQPEVAPLYQARITRRETVAKRTGNLAETYRVESIHAEQANLIKDSDDSRETVPVAELVVVRRMGEPIYPALISQDRISTTSQKVPHHILIEADNYHALQLLGYMYAGKVDCIYIDPPYNKRAKDWKYNNDYVDKNDQFRHSKWLAFMEKRLQLARRLLRPDQSVLIVSIDETEFNHLGLLLDQIFNGCNIQVVSTLINPANVPRAGQFGRSDEYIYFVMLGAASPQKVKLSREWVSGKGRTHTGNVRWDLLRRSGTNAERSHSPGCFYPIYIDPKKRTIEKIGAALPDGQSTPEEIHGLVAVLPIRKNRTEGNWQWSPSTFKERLNLGRVRVGGNEKRGFVIYILKDGEYAKIQRGEFQEAGRAIDGSIIVEDADTKFVLAVPGSQWRIGTHDATQYGSRLLADIHPDGKFNFPKSIYAVHDAVRFFVENNPNALILDFFGGSGTTLNAVNLLNCADGGQRQCILVTNNEVSEEEAHTLTEQGFQPGQTEWDRHGICQSVTWPRSKFTIQGMRGDGTPLPGDYLTGQQVAREKPRTIRQLGFAEGRHLTLSQRKQVAALLPSVPQNKIDDGPWFLDEDITVTILWDVQQAEAWLEALAETDHITELHVVTQESRLFNLLKKQIAETLGPLTVMEDDKRPLAAGFPANLDYFKLDFLQPAEVAMGQQFAAILPILWMKAGAIGPCPEPPASQAHWLIPVDCPFVVLMRESRFREFLAKVSGREDLTHVYLVTNSDSAFHDMRAEFPDHLEIIQLYKSYLDNFRINTATPNRSSP
jgi:adenine-specific DNA-methyltransferase